MRLIKKYLLNFSAYFCKNPQEFRVKTIINERKTVFLYRNDYLTIEDTTWTD